MNRSRSLVARGCAWNERAYPPTMRYLTLWALKTDKSSLKSSNIRDRALHRISSKSDLRNRIHPFMHGPALPIPVFIRLHFIKAAIHADSLVHVPSSHACRAFPGTTSATAITTTHPITLYQRNATF